MNKEIFKNAGELLHGKDWVTPLANDLNINRKTVQRWNKDELRINDNITDEVANLLYSKEQRIKKLRLSLSESFKCEDARQRAIKKFLDWNTSKLTPASKIYCKLGFNRDDYYQAEVTLDVPENLEGWQCYEFDEKRFVLELVNIRKELSKKMMDSMAVYDENLIGSYDLESAMDDFNY